MPKRGVYLEIDPRLKDDFQAFARGRGATFAAEVEYAMRRHLASPPEPAGRSLAAWTPEEESAAADRTRTAAEIALAIGRTKAAVESYRRRLKRRRST